ncbi:MAG: transposase [Betaproteobacteria bacterium]
MHAVQRGNNRVACFVDDEDRAFYLHHLGRLASQACCALHAYCLMTNHVHLLVTPERADGCAELFRRLGVVYTQYFNKRHERTGTLWEGRFRSSLIQTEAYLLACYRYIELNPVRAGMVVAPGLYRWSSYAVNAGEARDPCITPHAEYLHLGLDEEERRRQYRALFGTELETELVRDIRAMTNAGYVLGSESFQREIGRRLGRRVSPGTAGRPVLAETPGGAQRDLF